MADQQYCLRWNNHQTTLISVFESLQERGCMVDCTLAAEGQSLQAHKVVLSACSPYLEDLLSKHYDKHPILLLKDVKFEELKAMMDYMYRGEVNVAQDKLNTFLRAAESLQIKGLSDGGTDPPDSGGTGSMKRTAKGAPVSVRSNQQLTVRTTNLADDNSSRDGSVSPSLRKRRRRRGSDGSDHDNSSNVADGKQSSAAAAPVTGPTVINEDMLPTVPASGPSDDNLLSSILESTETENATDSGITSANNTVPLQENVIRDRDNVLIEPKTEYLDDDAQDLHLDDDDSMFRAGPSHARGSGNYEGDDGEDVYMANQDSGANAQGEGARVLNGNVAVKFEPMDSEEYRLWFDDSNPSDPEPSPPQQEPVRDCYVRLENIRLPGSTSRRAPRAERSVSPEGGRRDVGAGRSRGRSRSVAPSRPTSRTASRPRHKSKDARSSSCSRAPGALGMGTPRIVLGRSKSATGSRLLKCALCLKSFHLQASLSKHVRAHQRCTPDRCLICGKRVESLVQAMEHFMSHPADVHDDDDKVRCAVCAREFPRQRLYRLATHVLAHTGEAPFPCATCHRRFRTSYSLVTHAERVHGSRDAGVRRSAALVRAILPVYRCSVCPARLGTPKLLIEHKQQVHGAAAGGATCLYCPAALDSSEAMERHMAAQHASERPHACARCMKRFSTRHSLARHMLSHSHAYRCSLCPERFATARECLDHVNGVHLRPAH